MAALVLLVGMVAMLGMVANASLRTLSSRAREGATNVQREVIERTRGISYAQLTQAAAYTHLQTLPGLDDSSAAPGYQLTRRGISYTLVIQVCSVDDAKDGHGSHDLASFCAGSGSGTADVNPDDYKVITTDVSWSGHDARGHSRQQALINSSGANAGPAICAITLNGSTNAVITSAQSSLNVGLCLSSAPSTVAVSVDGKVLGSATGSGTTWSYSWPIDALPDGSYLLSARAYDAQGRPGAVRSLTVTLNRFLPMAPSGLAAGRNGSVVEAEWLGNQERDVVGYRLYRGSAVVASCSAVDTTSCQDVAPPGLDQVSYALRALDRDLGGALREGAASAAVIVTQGNQRPNPPTGLTLTANAQGDAVLNWSAPVPGDPDSGDAISFYRIYRDGTLIADRFDRTGLGSDLTWTDARSAGQSHSYWITAVDTQLAESLALGPVSS